MTAISSYFEFTYTAVGATLTAKSYVSSAIQNLSVPGGPTVIKVIG